MSTLQIQKCITDVLALDTHRSDSKPNWTQGNLKRLFKATSVLYTTSLNKVPLRNDEETVRGHICALMACERLAEKQAARAQNNNSNNAAGIGINDDSVIRYYMDRIPLEPRKINHLINVFKQNISQCSPVKQIQWSPSPKKARSRSNLSSPTKSPVKTVVNKFTSQDPKELRRVLFDGNSPKVSPHKTPQGKIPGLEFNVTLESPQKNDLSSPRRKLRFEMVDEDDEDGVSFTKGESPSTTNANPLELNSQPPSTKDKEESSLSKDPSETPLSTTTDTVTDPFKPRKRHKKYAPRNNNPLTKKFAKVVPSDVINLCNQFELPQDVSYNILDFFMANQTFLVHPWQLVCGLVLHCTYIIFNEKRRKDPRLNHLILQKMVDFFKADSYGEISESIYLVNELIIGEKWYRDLEIKYNYFQGFNYEESINIKLGSMLQVNSILFSDDQYESWKKNVLIDLSLKEKRT